MELFILIGCVYLADSSKTDVNERDTTTATEVNIHERPSVIQSCGNPKPLHTPYIYRGNRESQEDVARKSDVRKRLHSERENDELLCNDADKNNLGNESNPIEISSEESSEDEGEGCSKKMSLTNKKRCSIKNGIVVRRQKILDFLSSVWNCKTELITMDKQLIANDNHDNIMLYLCTMKNRVTNDYRCLQKYWDTESKFQQLKKMDSFAKLILNRIQFSRSNLMYTTQFIEALKEFNTSEIERHHNDIIELQQLLSDHIVTRMVNCFKIAEKITVDEIREFIIERAAQNNYYSSKYQLYFIKTRLYNLFVISLQMLFGTRIIEKITQLPEFPCIYGYFVTYCRHLPQPVAYTKIITIYIVNKCEIFLSAYIEVMDQTSNPSLETEKNIRTIAHFRLFIREILFPHLFYLFRVPIWVYSKYLFFSELEYIFLVSNDDNTLIINECIPETSYELLFFVVLEWNATIKFCWQILECEFSKNASTKSFNDKKIVGRVIKANYSSIKHILDQNVNRLCEYLESYLSINLSEMRSDLLNKIRKFDHDGGVKLQQALSFYTNIRKYLREMNRPVDNTVTNTERPWKLFVKNIY